MEILKPCPFCGRTKQIESYGIRPDQADPYWHIGCVGCGFYFEIAEWTEEEAVEAWNRRYSDGQSDSI